MQAIGWALNRGSLMRPLNLLQFVVVYTCPITPREGEHGRGSSPGVGLGAHSRQPSSALQLCAVHPALVSQTGKRSVGLGGLEWDALQGVGWEALVQAFSKLFPSSVCSQTAHQCLCTHLEWALPHVLPRLTYWLATMHP